MLVATQWRLVMCLFRKGTSCGPLALYKLTTIFVVDRKDDLSFLKGMSNDGNLDKIQAFEVERFFSGRKYVKFCHYKNTSAIREKKLTKTKR